MAIPESCGGGGASLRELGIVVGLAGSSIAPVSLVEHAVATRLLARLEATGCDIAPLADLSSLADGSTIATLALRPIGKTVGLASETETLDLLGSSRETTAASDQTARLLPAGAVANVFLALCDGDLLAASSPPPLISLPNTADLPIANREIPSASSEVITLATGTNAISYFRRAVSEWQALTAAAICGLGQRALQIGVDYALERKQFDRPIGSFQAVQHGLADAATELEAAYYLCQRALWMLDAEETVDFPRLSSRSAAAPDAQTFAAMAFLFASEAAQRAAAASLHYHGGYGYAEEYDIGLYYRRAKGWSLIYDNPAQEYQQLADTLLGPIPAH